ncbi:MAG: hypothetical protein AAGF87_17700 [Bacteroidota bacterium]
MSKRKNSRTTSTLVVAALATLLVSSCNRGYGCPANNMSTENSVLDVLGNFFTTLLQNGVEVLSGLVSGII